ncbi:hypothetical protein [Rheinheimera soli]|uniref:Uncharacterized protein n=1 Tax=Rheinheimera soli TaxID=443616 RepID=A0ABU1W576_9GAMM|nr:hypothetical protein [Rheinheimera soli]MDR7123110.1 hypothetical protein [Rheinheimera soli]
MKKGLVARGVDVFPYSKVAKKLASQVQPLLDVAIIQATENFNGKVDIWNEWAKANNEEILLKK